ncbi:MAG TPA: recombinase RecA [bacterium]|nr:recombinase RecA [bacterium]HOL46996.1 recombinase RecA [bacterium]HPQ19008.1 recombinase RecA [bacterium]
MAAKENDKEKEKILSLTLSSIEKKFGKGSIMKLGERSVIEVPVIPTGVLTLDIALGLGGIPRGKVIEIFGPESSGKTTLALSIIAQAQKNNGVAAFIDAEHALDPGWAKTLGVDVDNLLISQPDYGEQALDITEQLVNSGAVDVIVIDSVAALVPRNEIEGEMGDAHLGLQARLMSQALRKLTAAISKSKTVVIFINQIRMKIGMFVGNPETTTGGQALKFYSSIRLDVRKGDTLKKGESTYGAEVKIKVVKNKLSPPFKKASFEIYFDEGISTESCLINAGIDFNIIQKSGTWLTYGDVRLGQGKDNARIYLKNNPELVNEIYNKILEKANIIKTKEM